MTLWAENNKVYFLADEYSLEGSTRCTGCKKKFGMNLLHRNTIMTADWRRGGQGRSPALSHTHARTHLWWFPPRLLVCHSWTRVICMPPLQHADRTAFGNTHLLITCLLRSLLFPGRCPCVRMDGQRRTLTHNSTLSAPIFKHNLMEINITHTEQNINKLINMAAGAPQPQWLQTPSTLYCCCFLFLRSGQWSGHTHTKKHTRVLELWVWLPGNSVLVLLACRFLIFFLQCVFVQSLYANILTHWN